MASILLLQAFVAAFFCTFVQHGDATCTGEWNYNYSTPIGPYSWYKTCQTCAGNSQSPVDISMEDLVTPYDVSMFKQLHINTITAGSSFYLTNTGQSLQLKFDTLTKITVFGAGLPGEFIASQIHWHWGSDNNQGSEHTVDSIRYPMEGHLVTYNPKYPDFNSAVGQTDGLAVFGMFYRFNHYPLSGSHDLVYQMVFHNSSLSRLSAPQATIEIPAIDINYLLPLNRVPFYRYHGSLTTPGCSEGVIWTVFSEVITLSDYLIEPLRNLYFETTLGRNDSMMVNNYRPVQPLNGRIIYRVDPYGYIAKSAASSLLASWTIILIAEVLRRLMNE